jgi:hypothetical protein
VQSRLLLRLAGLLAVASSLAYELLIRSTLDASAASVSFPCWLVASE